MGRRWIFAAITGTWLFSAGGTYACGTDAEFAQPPPKPRPTTASELLVRANELDSEAQGHDQTALAFDAEADRLSNRARLLRNQALLVSFSDRDDIDDIADELTTKANVLRVRASRERPISVQLRAEARTLRDRAAQLARVTRPNGWRRGVSL